MRSKKRSAATKRGFLVNDKKRKAGGLIYTQGAKRERDYKLGKMGAASGVRKIDPATGAIVDLMSVREFVEQQPDTTRKTVRVWRNRK